MKVTIQDRERFSKVSYNGVIYAFGDVFEIEDSLMEKPFWKNMVEPAVEKAVVEVPKAPVEAAPVWNVDDEPDAKPDVTFSVVHKQFGKYDVVNDLTGEIVNDEPIKGKDAAQEFADKLLATFKGE